MALISQLFSDWVGILSFLVIAIVLAIGGFFVWLFLLRPAPEPPSAEAQPGTPPPPGGR